jgi:acyl-coenzyme A synthetase/AMP-(fatty) acid ligase
MQAMAPLMAGHSPQSALLWRDGQPVPASRFLAQARALATRLPEAGQPINLCDDRYAFMLAFAAALLRGHPSLLPPNRSVEVIREIAGEYPGSYILYDQDSMLPDITALKVEWDATQPASEFEAVQIPRSQLAALVFTSGSTGRARANPKTWGSLCDSTSQACERFLSTLDATASIVATVPPQHMYGLETSVLLPLLAGAAVHSARPFFPEDVSAALAVLPAPRVLVTTPVHLRACVKAGIRPPPVDFIISATAPLATELALEAEALFAAPVREIYGCTEVGSMASRRTQEGPAWTLYDRTTLELNSGIACVRGPQLADAVELQDVIEKIDERHFVLRGRNSDMLNIAGKRASLADLNIRLQSIEGVVDAVIFQPDDEDGPTARLAALVVAPTLTREVVLAALREKIDPVFLPRPLLLVEALPRSDTTKLPRQALHEALRSASEERG